MNTTSPEAGEAGDRQYLIAQAMGDFRVFCGLLKLVTDKGGDRIPFRFSPIQRDFNAARTGRDIVLKPRRAYMTTLEVARNIWWFLSRRGARVLMVCQPQKNDNPQADQGVMFQRFFDALRAHGLRLDFREKNPTHSWTLPKRDSTMRIISAGGSEEAAVRGVRGVPCNRLHVTEAGFLGAYATDMFTGVFPAIPMAPHGEITIESTPNGAGGWYYDQWRAAVEGRSAFRPHFFEWWRHPLYRLPVPEGEAFAPATERERALLARGVTPENLLYYRQAVRESGGDERKVAQEYPDDPDSCFLITGRGHFDAARLHGALLAARAPIETYMVLASGDPSLAALSAADCKRYRNVRVWHAPEPGRRYVLALDPSEGGGGDPSGGILLDRASGRHCATIWGQFAPEQLAKAGAWLGGQYGNAEIAVERNNHGHACLLALGSAYQSIGLAAPYPKVFVDSDGKLGWLNHGPARTLAVDNLESAFRAQHFDTPDAELLGEMRTFVVSASGKAEAAKGAHDDLVLAACIAWNVACRVQVRRDGTNLPLR